MFLNKYEEFLSNNYKKEIVNLIYESESNFNHASITIDLTVLKSESKELYCEIIDSNSIQNAILKWDTALLNILKKNYMNNHSYALSLNYHVRFYNLPDSENLLNEIYPNNEFVGQFVQITGNVVQITQEKLIEIRREMICSKCNSTFEFETKYEKMYKFDVPERCLKRKCKGILNSIHNFPKLEFCMDFQQIKLQKIFPSVNENYATSIVVCLENDLVNICKPGDCLTICGTIEVWWSSLIIGFRGVHTLSLRANSVVKDKINPNIIKKMNDQLSVIRTQSQNYVAKLGAINTRDLIIDSICPEITGIKCIKLGVVLALCSGFYSKNKSTSVKRNHSHVFLVGDPGTGKSKLLKTVCQVITRAIYTNGLGCSAAGLTAAAFKNGSEWNLQAGALVLADGGVCCIDQFHLMQQHDKAAVLETMEQQTISLAKAGLVCKIQTMCVILASANLTSFYKSSVSKTICPSNLGVQTPLLSRFDLIFSINDAHETKWDIEVSNHLINLTKSVNKFKEFKYWNSHELRSYFAVVKGIEVKFSELANIILGSYYKFYRSYFKREISRTTVRMFESVNRLAQSHARLMFRNEVIAFDAFVVIQLIETTWGFGKIIQPINFFNKGIRTDCGLISSILSNLGLSALEDKCYLSDTGYNYFKLENHLQNNDFARKIYNNANMVQIKRNLCIESYRQTEKREWADAKFPKFISLNYLINFSPLNLIKSKMEIEKVTPILYKERHDNHITELLKKLQSNYVVFKLINNNSNSCQDFKIMPAHSNKTSKEIQKIKFCFQNNVSKKFMEVYKLNSKNFFIIEANKKINGFPNFTQNLKALKKQIYNMNKNCLKIFQNECTKIPFYEKINNIEYSSETKTKNNNVKTYKYFKFSSKYEDLKTESCEIAKIMLNCICFEKFRSSKNSGSNNLLQYRKILCKEENLHLLNFDF